jgi:hypothetical protein
MIEQFAYVIAFLAAGILSIALILFISRSLRPFRPNAEKLRFGIGLTRPWMCATRGGKMNLVGIEPGRIGFPRAIKKLPISTQ